MLKILLALAWLYLATANNTNDTQCFNVVSSGKPLVSGFPVRIMQYNAEWLFLKTYNGCPGTSCSWPTEDAAAKHMTYVANTINTLKPDIINLCEVEGCYELCVLAQQLNDSYTPYLLFGTDTATGQNVGLLTKYAPASDLWRTSATAAYPVPGSKCGYTGTGTTGVSKHYVTSYYVGNRTLFLLGAHLLAIPTEPSRCAQREAQATVLAQLITNILADPTHDLIVLGDMNDYDDAVPDSNNNAPTSNVLSILKTAGNLTSAASLLPQSQRYTDWYDPNGDCKAQTNEYSMIDHVLVSPGLVNKITEVSIPHIYDEYCGTYNSDHYPVMITLVM